MRRCLALLGICLLALALAGCGQKGDPSPRRDLHREATRPKPSPASDEAPHG